MPKYLQFKKLQLLFPITQIISIIILYLIQTYTCYLSYRATGQIFGYPLFAYLTIIFAPIYEEIIFRGFILHAFLCENKPLTAIIFSSLIFGLWHFKNIFFLSPYLLTKQILYTGLIFGPVMALVTYKTKTIWSAVILHYLNNILFFLIA